MENNLLTKNNNSFLNESLSLLRDMGYTEIRFPGGTHKNGDHYSGVVIYKYDPTNKKVYFLVVPYDPESYKKNPDQIRRKPIYETPVGTAIREVYEETALSIKSEDLVELENIRYSVQKHRSKDQQHIKHFFITKEYTGTPAQFQGGNPIEAETASPLWIEGEELNKVVCKQHQRPFREALNHLAMNIKYCDAMLSYLHSYHHIRH